MTGTLAAALLSAESVGTVAVLSELGTVDEITAEVVDLAVAPIAPLAGAALAEAVRLSAPSWAPALQAFSLRLGEQRSLLALADTLEVLLEAPAAAGAASQTLYSALLSDHDQVAREHPELAVARLEGALRIALAGAAPPFLVLHHLAAVDPNLPQEYLEGLPRLIGIALDKWDTDVGLTSSLVEALESLTDVEAAASGATHEVGCLRMRAALRQEDSAAAAAGLAEAAEIFAVAANLDEARDDARAYGAVCAAVSAFASNDVDRLAGTSDDLNETIRRRIAWHSSIHEPAWRRPLLDAEVEWLGLVIDLRDASDKLSEPSWLDAAAAVGQLSRAYTAERATVPAAGLTAVVRPVIENAVADRAVLENQLMRVIGDDRRRDPPVLPPGAGLLADAIRARHRDGHHRGASDDDADEEGDLAKLDGRIDRLGPRLRLLGNDVARVLARNADDVHLIEAEAVLAASTSSGVLEHPVLRELRQEIVERLPENPAIDGETRAVVIALVDHTLTFLLDRYDRGGPMLPGRPNILRRLAEHEDRPHEEELGREFCAVCWTGAV